MQVDERTAAASSVFKGRSYYFCCAGCKKKFEASPSAYVGAPPPAGDTMTAAKDPVCGMTVTAARNLRAPAPPIISAAHRRDEISRQSRALLVATTHRPVTNIMRTRRPVNGAGGAADVGDATCPMRKSAMRSDCPPAAALVPIAGTGGGGRRF
jgi:YHS domain-containing protein